MLAANQKRVVYSRWHVHASDFTASREDGPLHDGVADALVLQASQETSRLHVHPHRALQACGGGRLRHLDTTTSGLPFSTIYVASSAAFPSPAFLAA